jgi:lipopolysaccharide/colanic/teichoic acid biosynthesis glycosyltransferase
MLYSAYRIKKESPDGPIFFKQKRVRANGEEFVCVKFRSMIPDAEKGNPQFTSENDSRVFKWGETMRKTRIDELPQMWNILKGEMHLIGPRPERKYWTDQFEKEIPYYAERHLVAPGVTGWAQVMYEYGANAEDAKQKLMYDLYYIKYWNIFLELKIVYKTAMTVVGKKGV